MLEIEIRDPDPIAGKDTDHEVVFRTRYEAGGASANVERLTTAQLIELRDAINRRLLGSRPVTQAEVDEVTTRTPIASYGRAHNSAPGMRCWCHLTHVPAFEEEVPR
jgi:hypothetical protein